MLINKMFSDLNEIYIDLKLEIHRIRCEILKNIE